jgi:hypothetical protein
MKIIRLTESDLTNIVKRVISENDSMTEKKYKTYSKLLNKLTEKFDWVSKIDVKLSSTADAGGWIGEESKPLLIVSVYFKNYQKIRMTTQFELFDEISFIHDMFFPQVTGDPRIYSDNVTTYFSVKSVFPNGKTGFFPIQIVSGDYDAVSQISESQLTNIVKRVISENDSMLEKNKKFLKNKLGIDFTNGIQQVTSTYDVPMEFDYGISSDSIRRYLNNFGPMYLFEYDGIKYLYQDRGFEFFIDENGFDYVDGEIPEKLGIDEMGLRFSNIIDLYFKEEEL